MMKTFATKVAQMQTKATLPVGLQANICDGATTMNNIKHMYNQ